MDLEKVFEKLGLTALDESAQADVKKFIAEAIELKAKEKAKELSEDVIKEEKAKLVEDFEVKFSDYKEEVLSKWSDFVDSVIEEEVKLPESVVEFAAIGEKYKPIMDQIRMALAIDEGTVESEAKKLLAEAKEEITKLRAQLNKLMGESMELKEDNKIMAVQLHLRKKCDGLTEAQKKVVMDMLGDLSDVKKINEKFDFVVENFLLIEKKKKDCDCEKEEDEDGEDVSKDDKDGKTGDDLEKSDDEVKKEKKKEKKDKKDSAKGITESAEIPSNWEQMLEGYAATAKKGF